MNSKKDNYRTVPNQEPEEITRIVKDFVVNEFKKLNSKNTVKIDCDHAGKWVFTFSNFLVDC